MPKPSMPASSVRSRSDLGEYLDQSLLTEYYERVEGRVTRQVSTSLKSYLIEFHLDGRSPDEALVSTGFEQVRPTAEPSLWLALDKDDSAYFVDLLDERFPIVHTIAKTNATDAAIERFVASARGADRCWLPSQFLLGQDLGRVIGFRFYHQRVTGGLEDSEEAKALARDLGREHPPAFRLAVTDNAHAGDDLVALRSEDLFGARSALQSLSWRKTFGTGADFIHDEVWSIGKVSAYGTSWEGHLTNIFTLRDRYAGLLRRLERDFALRWSVDSDESSLELAGEPIEIHLDENSPITDVDRFVEDLLVAKSPFRLWGVVTRIQEGSLAVDAIDLHTGHRFGLEVGRTLIRVFLRSETCGNVFTRLLCNLERHLSSEVVTSVDRALIGANE